MIPFVKMDGLGNDFVIIDERYDSFPELDWQKIADRENGIGCDQVIVLKESDKADVYMQIINADGGEVEACGNATRCVGWLLEKEEVLIETSAGILNARNIGDFNVEVDMGEPVFYSRDLDISGAPIEVAIGNPHLVFFVDGDVDSIDLESFAAPLETHQLFPDRTNVEVAEIISKEHIKMRVWERGAGITQACGTGACAVAAAAIKQDLVEKSVKLQMPGGDLQIIWQGTGSSLLMQGPVSLNFRSQIDAETYGKE